MILVCGEALIDIFAASGSAGGEISMRGHPGGSPMNVAVGLARLGRDTTFLGALSSDFFGDRLRRHLRDERVDMRFAKSSDKPTPLSFVSVAEDGLVAYAFRNEGAADRDLEAADMPRDLAPEIACVTVGSYTIGLDRAGAAMVDFAVAAARDRVVSFDPNVRLDLIEDRDAWHRRFDRLTGASAIVKISREDIDLAFGAEADTATLAGEIVARGAALVVVTAGSSPVQAFGRFGRVEMQGPDVAVVDTVGAGDSFHAALLARLDATARLSRPALDALEAAEASAVLSFACRAAAITCTRRGADLPTLAEMDRIGQGLPNAPSVPSEPAYETKPA